ncbi:hypothetical protein [Deinococcus pimensis]|uniref:hypothetical protein n=1 Tax=Deinococcus pimensis TaxID=309888 RepID=UPI000485D970|nr:hypothetical protein [Deinococcus pimensis]
MEPSPAQIRDVRLHVQNHQPHDVTLVVEPWGEEVVLLAGMTVTVIVRGVRAAEVELVWGEQYFTLFAAPGSTLAVEDERGSRVLDIEIPVPGLPEGMSTRAFVRQVLEGEAEI